MKWPRATVRQLMITIAILALGLGAISWIAEMRARSTAHRRRAFELHLSTLRMGSFVTLTDGRRIDRYEDENDRRHDEWV